MQVGFSIDDQQGLSASDELRSVRLAAELGYTSAWTPSHADAVAFDRCFTWFRETGLPTGISVVPASGQTAAFYAGHARRVWDGTGGKFVLGVGSGQMVRAGRGMPAFLAELRSLLPPELPVYVAALGPRMLRLAGEQADGVALNWCSAEQAAWSRTEVAEAASRAGRPAPVIAEYIRTAVDHDYAAARKVLGQSVLRYALGPVAYRQHFQRMGFAEELVSLQNGTVEPSRAFVSAIGVSGAPGETRSSSNGSPNTWTWRSSGCWSPGLATPSLQDWCSRNAVPAAARPSRDRGSTRQPDGNSGCSAHRDVAARFARGPYRRGRA